jgi:hypothetical protein
VKAQALSVCLAVILCVAAMESQRSLPETPGKLEIAKYPLVLEAPIGPQAQKLDPAKLHDEAAELARLAQSLPLDVDQATQGKLAKDLPDKLKRIEKLSKKLRGELAP